MATMARLKIAQHSCKEPGSVISDLVAFSYLNQVRSCLMRLPDNVLVAIMIQLEPHEMAKLRHVSREFMRIFDQHPHFKQYHATITKKWLESAPWAVPDPSLFYDDQSVSNWPSLCEFCQSVRRDDLLGEKLLVGMPLLYCSGCKTTHRIMHFSKHQREGSTDDDRVCLGHEVCIEPDKGMLVSWRQAVAISRCRPRGKGIILADADTPCKGDSCTQPGRSHVEFAAVEGGKMRMAVQLVQHFPIKRQADGRIDGRTLWETGWKIRERDGRGYQLSVMRVDASNILRAFDPNVCSCVDWGERVSFSSATACSFAWQLAAPPRDAGPKHISGAHLGTQGRCLGRQHGYTMRYAMGDYQVNILRCPDDPQMLVLQTTFFSEISSPMDPAWRCNLSYGGCHYGSDKAMRGITWCRDEGCGVAQALGQHQSLMELEWKYGL